MVVDATLVALACGIPELLYIGQPVGAAIDVEVIAEYYDLKGYLERKPPTEHMDKIHAACHPHVKKPLLTRLALPVLDQPTRQALASWVLG